MKSNHTLRSKHIIRTPALSGLLAVLLGLCVTPTRAQIAVQEWVQKRPGAGFATAIAAATNGNVIVTGWNTFSWYGMQFGYYITVEYSSAGVPQWTGVLQPGWVVDSRRAIPYAIAVDNHNRNVYITGDCATLAYSSDGGTLWTNYLISGSRGCGNAIAVDPRNGNVYVAGSLNSYDYPYWVTWAFTSAGTLLWTNLYSGPEGVDEAMAVAVDAHSGNVYVTGWSDRPYYQDYATIAYTSEGMALWTNRYASEQRDNSASAIAVGANGNVYVTGSSLAGNAYPYSVDYATVAYSSAGAPLWTNCYAGLGDWGDGATGIAADSDGNIFVTGSLIETNGDFSTNYNYVTINYSGDGVPLWTNRYDGPGSSDDWASAMAVGACGNVYVTGQSGDQYTTLAYSSAGTPLWTNCYATPNEYLWPAMAVDANENVYVAGTYWDGTYFGYVTIKYSVPRPIPLTLQLLDNQLVLSWTNAAFHLQCAPTITAPFTNMPGATSPYTNFMTGAQSFFRLIRN